MKKCTLILFAVIHLVFAGVNAQDTPLQNPLSYAVDTPQNAAVLPSPFAIRGWVLDTNVGEGNGPGVDLVQVYEGDVCTGTLLGEAVPSVARPDVVTSLNLDESYTNSGFVVEITAPAGALTITTCVRRSTNQQILKIDTRLINVRTLRGSVDVPADGVLVKPLTRIAGWVFNTTTGAGNGPGVDSIRIYRGKDCNGDAWLETVLAHPRQDVVNALSLDASYLNMGFLTTFKFFDIGKVTFTVCAKGAGEQSYNPLATRTVYVSEVEGYASPADGVTLTLPFQVNGWVVANGGTGVGPGIDVVRVYEGEGCEGLMLAETWSFIPRRGAVQGLGLDETYTNSGFQIEMTSLPLGPNVITVCARNVFTGRINIVRIIRLTITE